MHGPPGSDAVYFGKYLPTFREGSVLASLTECAA